MQYNCKNCLLAMPCAMQIKPPACYKCYRRSCDGCKRFCLIPSGQLDLLDNGLSDDVIKKLTKIFEGACGDVGDFRTEYRRYCRYLAEQDLDFVLEFYKYCYFFNISLAIKIRCIYSVTKYKNEFKDYINK